MSAESTIIKRDGLRGHPCHSSGKIKGGRISGGTCDKKYPLPLWLGQGEEECHIGGGLQPDVGDQWRRKLGIKREKGCIRWWSVAQIFL